MLDCLNFVRDLLLQYLYPFGGEGNTHVIF